MDCRLCYIPVCYLNNARLLSPLSIDPADKALNEAVRNILKHTNLNIFEAVSLASINPARLINLDKTKGSIKIGKDADLIIFDESFKIEASILEGKFIYQAN
ncbi:hypothetical protein EOM82_06445 [bacterium]|nr:hypothetical protein [bacterium]